MLSSRREADGDDSCIAVSIVWWCVEEDTGCHAAHILCYGFLYIAANAMP